MYSIYFEIRKMNAINSIINKKGRSNSYYQSYYNKLLAEVMASKDFEELRLALKSM